MPLDQDQIDRLMTSVADTHEGEISCDDCLAGMAEFAEANLLGLEVPEALDRIRAHLAVCGDCAEEYEVLFDALRTGSKGGATES